VGIFNGMINTRLSDDLELRYVINPTHNYKIEPTLNIEDKSWIQCSVSDHDRESFLALNAEEKDSVRKALYQELSKKMHSYGIKMEMNSWREQDQIEIN
jgi:hypothetical protein